MAAVEARHVIIYDNLPTVEVLEHKADDRGNIYTLQKPINYCGVWVPAGFECDGASVPRFLWGVVFPPGDKQAMYAAVFHDFVCRTHPRHWSRKQADDAFLFLMRAGGVPSWRAQKAYWGVRLFGMSAWNAGGKSK